MLNLAYGLGFCNEQAGAVQGFCCERTFFCCGAQLIGIFGNICYTESMDDGKVILKKIIIADTEEPDTEPQENSAAPSLSADIKMLVTSMIHKDQKSFARVSFLRGSDWAEGIVPGGRIEKSEGFDREEIEKLEAYLAGEEEMILKQARGVNPIRNLFSL